MGWEIIQARGAHHRTAWLCLHGQYWVLRLMLIPQRSDFPSPGLPLFLHFHTLSLFKDRAATKLKTKNRSTKAKQHTGFTWDVKQVTSFALVLSMNLCDIIASLTLLCMIITKKKKKINNSNWVLRWAKPYPNTLPPIQPNYTPIPCNSSLLVHNINTMLCIFYRWGCP